MSLFITSRVPLICGQPLLKLSFMPLIYMLLLKLPSNTYTVVKSVLIADILKKFVRPLPPNDGAGGGIKHSQITSCQRKVPKMCYRLCCNEVVRNYAQKCEAQVGLLDASNIGSFYRFVNKRLGNKTGICPLHDGSKIVIDDSHKANLSGSVVTAAHTTICGPVCVPADGVHDRCHHLSPPLSYQPAVI